MSRGGGSKAKEASGPRRRSAPRPGKTSGSSGPTAGTRLVAALREGIEALRSEGPGASAVTVRTYRLGVEPPPEVGPAEARAARAELGLSQSVFAEFLGVSPSTVRAWEQGKRGPSPLARRFLGEIRREPEHWRRAVRAHLKEGPAGG
ncbi:helix-turn-helix domain-containing protein [Tautonia plasticadhaerens]|uniref:Helix-turn-helix protein n=1 Tax=Tautonia plasticadhaerens TaxID=2527974 RepID=A0A518HF03_9BACT|nr:helix-turn-helix domain-containing protein [Tautonia plasticadhaerens]QDV39429.1 helix-turn-helix protein [Tautonia plasticadhaerens]